MGETFQVLADRKSLADRAFDEIFHRIVSGEIRWGEQLNEVHIAAQMGVSRAPVREAIQRLRQKGLIVVAPGRHPAVIQLNVEDVRQLYSVRVALENAAIDEIEAAAAAQVADSLAEVIESIKRHVKAGEVTKVLEAEIRFHEVLVEASGNGLLQDLYSTLLAKLRMVLAVSIDTTYLTDLMEVADCHNEIVDLVRDGKFAEVKELLKQHIWSSYSTVAEQPVFSPAPVSSETARRRA